VPVARGRAHFAVDDLPFIVLGRISSRPGKPQYPAPTVVKTITVYLQNAGFEQAVVSGGITGWQLEYDPAHTPVKAFVDKTVRHTGTQSLCIQADQTVGGFWTVSQPVPISWVPTLAQDQYATVSIEGWLKAESVVGTGISLSCSFFDANGSRMSWIETPYKPGTWDWKVKTWNDFPIPAGTKTMRIQCVLGPGSGKARFDDAKMTIKVWKRPSSVR
jgi:hypothetical protein